MDLCPVVDENMEMRLKFQVADVQKPLIAVRRLVEKGTRVVFGPDPAENYIENVKTGKNITMRKKESGSYMSDTDFVKKKTEENNGYWHGQ